MVEYAILCGGIALVGILWMSLVGRKSTDLIGTLAVIMPGANANENRKVKNSTMIELTVSGDGATYIFNTSRLSDPLLGKSARIGFATGLYSSDSNNLIVVPTL